MRKKQDKTRSFFDVVDVDRSSFLLVCFVLCVLFCAPTNAANVKKNQNDVDFTQRVSIVYVGGSISDFLERHSKEYGFPYFLDRRVDASTLISCSTNDAPLVDALDEVFSSAGLSFCVVDNSFIYVGPQGAASDALTLFEITRSQMELGEIPQKTAYALSSVVDFQIAPYSEPRDVFKALAKKAPRVKISGFDKTPFDRWRACSFENVSVNDLLVILALGFDVEYYYDRADSLIKPRALKRDRKATILYSNEIAGKLSPNQFPKCAFKNEGLTLRVDGEFQDLVPVAEAAAKIRRDLAIDPQKENDAASASRSRSNHANSGSRRRANDNSEQVVDGNVKDVRLQSLFNDLEKRLGIRCVLDSSLVRSGVTLNTRISCEFHNAGKEIVANVIAQKINARPVVNNNEIIFVAK